MAAQSVQKRLQPSPEIPDRLYFRIGDVAKICSVEPYVLRFWETQFPALKPNKGGTGQRLYRRREVELVLEIKRLVHAEGYTLAGARQALDLQNRSSRRSASTDPRPEPQQPQLSRLTGTSSDSQHRESIAATIGHARAELRELAAQLASPAPRPVRRRPRLTAVPITSDLLFPT